MDADAIEKRDRTPGPLRSKQEDRRAAEGYALEAAQGRFDLADNAGCLALAIDTAESVGVESALDNMLAHQLASAHQLAMKLAWRAAMHINNAAHDGFGPERRTYHSDEAVRAAAASARMMEAFPEGAIDVAPAQVRR